MGKGENAVNQHFLPFPQCFLPYHKQSLPFKPHLTLSQTSPCFYLSAVQVLEKNTVGKGDITCNEQFHLFPTVLFTRLDNFLPFLSNLKLSSANSFSFDQFEILSFGKGLNCHLQIL